MSGDADQAVISSGPGGKGTTSWRLRASGVMPQSMIGVVGGVASQDYRSNSYQTLEDDSGTQHESGKAHSLEALVWVVHGDREL